jgi:hypothetical protein
MRDYGGVNSGRIDGLPQCGSEPANQDVTGRVAGVTTIGLLGRSRRAQRTDAVDQLTDGGIDGNPAFGFEFAQWYMDGPLVGAQGAQAIDGEIDTFADAHAGVTQKQQDVTGEVIAPEQFLLDQLILLWSQRPRQVALLAGNIVTIEQMGEVRELLRPGKVFQHPAQSDHVVGARYRGEGRLVRAQESQPAQDGRIAAQLLERINFRKLSAEISQKAPDGSPIGGDGGIAQRSRY